MTSNVKSTKKGKNIVDIHTQKSEVVLLWPDQAESKSWDRVFLCCYIEIKCHEYLYIKLYKGKCYFNILSYRKRKKCWKYECWQKYNYINRD